MYNYPYPKLVKMLYFSCYRLCLLFNKIGEEGRAGSAWKPGGGGGEWGSGGRDGPKNVCTYELI
jgi:hypothetical protein